MGCFHLFDGPSDHLVLSIAVPPTKVAALRLQPSWTKEYQGDFVATALRIYPIMSLSRYDGAEPGVLDGQTRGGSISLG